MQFCASEACQFNGRAGSSHSFLSTSASPGPLSHALAHSPDLTHTTVSAPLQHRHSDNGTLWLSYFCYKKKKKRKELQSQMTPQLQNRKTLHNSDGTMKECSKQTGNWQEKKALKKKKKTKPRCFSTTSAGLSNTLKLKLTAQPQDSAGCELSKPDRARRETMNAAWRAVAQ